jgi:hypothetical protein
MAIDVAIDTPGGNLSLKLLNLGFKVICWAIDVLIKTVGH